MKSYILKSYEAQTLERHETDIETACFQNIGHWDTTYIYVIIRIIQSMNTNTYMINITKI